MSSPPRDDRSDERDPALRAYLMQLNPDSSPEEIDSIDLAIFDCGGCG